MARRPPCMNRSIHLPARHLCPTLTPSWAVRATTRGSHNWGADMRIPVSSPDFAHLSPATPSITGPPQNRKIAHNPIVIPSESTSRLIGHPQRRARLAHPQWPVVPSERCPWVWIVAHGLRIRKRVAHARSWHNSWVSYRKGRRAPKSHRLSSATSRRHEEPTDVNLSYL